MPNQYTVADSLYAFNTGAVSSGAVQDDPLLSLGGYASSTPVQSLRITASNLPEFLEVNYVSPSNGEGSGSLVFVGNGITWQAPGSLVAGSAVSVTNGQTKILVDGEDPSKYVRVSKWSTATADQTGVIVSQWEEYTSVSMGYVTEAKATAGGSTYRSIGLSNESISEISDLSVYSPPLAPAVISAVDFLPASGTGTIKTTGSLRPFPLSGHLAIYDSAGALKEVVYGTRNDFGYDVLSAHRGLCGTSATLGAVDDTFAPVYGVELALEAPVGDQITTSADEDTAPSAISFSSAFTEATAVTQGTLFVGAWVGLHLKRDTAIGSEAIADLLGSLLVTFTVGGITYTSPLTAIFRIANAEEYELFVSETSTIDFEAGAVATSATLPVSYAITPPVSGTKSYWYVTRKTNRFGLTSLNEYPRKISVGVGGEEVLFAPTSPYGTTLEDGIEGDVIVRTNYDRASDEGSKANRWSIWASVGSDPDPDVDTPVATRGIPEVSTVGDISLMKATIGPYPASSDLRVVVRVFRFADSVTDGNTDVILLTTAPIADAPRDIVAVE